MSVSDVTIGNYALGWFPLAVREAAPALCRQASEHGYGTQPNTFGASWLNTYGGVLSRHSYGFGAMIKRAHESKIHLRWTCDGVDHESATVRYERGEFIVTANDDEPDWRDLAQRLATELERQHVMSHDVDFALLAECRAAGLDVRGDS